MRILRKTMVVTAIPVALARGPTAGCVPIALASHMSMNNAADACCASQIAGLAGSGAVVNLAG